LIISSTKYRVEPMSLCYYALQYFTARPRPLLGHPAVHANCECTADSAITKCYCTAGRAFTVGVHGWVAQEGAWSCCKCHYRGSKHNVHNIHTALQQTRH